MTQLLDDLMGDVGLRALTRFIAVRGMAARAVAELVEGQRDLRFLCDFARVVVSGHPLEVPVPLAGLIAEQVDRDQFRLARRQSGRRAADMPTDPVCRSVGKPAAAGRRCGVDVLHMYCDVDLN